MKWTGKPRLLSSVLPPARLYTVVAATPPPPVMLRRTPPGRPTSRPSHTRCGDGVMASPPQPGWQQNNILIAKTDNALIHLTRLPGCSSSDMVCYAGWCLVVRLLGAGGAAHRPARPYTLQLSFSLTRPSRARNFKLILTKNEYRVQFKTKNM